MKKKDVLLCFVIVLSFALSACGLKGSGSIPSNGLAGASSANPATLLPVSLPASLEGTVYHPEIYDPVSKAYVQIQTIAQDVREIPPSVWGFSEGVSPDVSGSIALYIKVRAGDQEARDPFWSDGAVSRPDIRAVGQDGLVYPLSGCLTLSKGETYPPPAPGYESLRSDLQPGESREGWVICAAPLVNIDDQNFYWTTSNAERSSDQYAWTTISKLSFSSWAGLLNLVVKDRSSDSVVYRGKAWMSVVESELMDSQAEGESVSPGLISTDECSGTVIVESGSEGLCAAGSGNLLARFHIRIAYPGMPESAELNPDLYVSQMSVSVGLSQDNLFDKGELVDLPLSGWVSAKVPDSASELWFFVDAGNRIAWSSSFVGLVATPSGQDYCEDGKCIGPLGMSSFVPGYAEYNDIPKAFEKSSRYLCPGETAMGTIIGSPIWGAEEYVQMYPVAESVDLTSWSKFGRGSHTSSLYIPVSTVSLELLHGAHLFVEKDGLFQEPIELSPYGYLERGDPPVSWSPPPFVAGPLVTDNAYLYAEIVNSHDLGSMYVVLDDPSNTIWRLSCEPKN